MDNKTCFQCGETKPNIGFYKNKTKKDGLSSQCKECQNKYQEKYRSGVLGMIPRKRGRKKGYKNESVDIDLSNFTGMDYTRQKIRIRDNHTCQICGKKWQPGQRRFDVHHKDCDKEKSRKYDQFEKEKDNLVTLCHKCHISLHFKILS